MKIEKFYCDKCGREAYRYGVMGFKIETSGLRLPAKEYYSERYPERKDVNDEGLIDLCEICHNNLMDIIKGYLGKNSIGKGGKDED